MYEMVTYIPFSVFVSGSSVQARVTSSPEVIFFMATRLI